MHGTFALIVAALALALPVTGAAGATEAEKLHALFQERFEWRMREFPREAMRRGDYTNADHLADNSLAAIERRHGETREHLERLGTIDASRLGPVDALSRQLFALQLEWAIRDHRFRMFLTPVGQRSGIHQDIAQMTERVRFQTGEDYEDYLSRLGQVPKAVDDAIELMRLGLEEGRTPPRVILDGVPGQFEALLDGGGLDVLAEPFSELPEGLTDMQRETLPHKFELEAVPAVRGAVMKLRDFVVEEYLPKCRTTIAASDLPEGALFYEHQLAKVTTTKLGARAIHALGLKEVARIRAEMMEVIRRSDFLEHFPDDVELPDDELFAKFLEYLRTDPRFYFDDPDALLAGYRDVCKRVDAELPRYFRVLPRLPYGVKAIPAFMAPQQTTAYYSAGDIDNAEPGWFYANTYALDQRPRYEMIALAMHEAVPGHHLQIALANELDGLPEFRQYLWVTAFGEGWALYAERLGIEMGLYEDPYDDFGRLLYEMWRACRLVVDPGIHAFGWSRERAISYMLENTALAQLNIENEVDRYIGWPGQACGYKIGELRIRELRREAEETLGDVFDIRAFHEVVLGAGAVPLPVLAERVRRWIRSHPAGAAYD